MTKRGKPASHSLDLSFADSTYTVAARQETHPIVIQQSKSSPEQVADYLRSAVQLLWKSMMTRSKLSTYRLSSQIL
jgi:hypothetical protein